MGVSDAIAKWAGQESSVREYLGATTFRVPAEAGDCNRHEEGTQKQTDGAGKAHSEVRSERRDRMRRRIDIANVSINATQLAAVIGIAWLIATMYQKVLDRMDHIEERAVQVQSQIGETNQRLTVLEQKVGYRN